MPIGKTTHAISVQPIAWWRNAAREKSHVFCSWTRNEIPGEEQRERGHERPPRARELPAHDGELHGARDHRRLRPGRVREEVHRRERREDHDDPEHHAGRERERRPEVGAPASAAEHLGPDDRLREQDEPEHEEQRGEEPVGDLSLGDHARPSRDPAPVPARSGARRARRRARRGAAAGRGSRTGSCRVGGGTRCGTAGQRAHTSPPRIVIGPRS